MKLFCDSTDFADAVSKVTKAMPLKKLNPILEGIKLKAEGDVLILSSTDLELAIEKKINADVKIEGEALINGRSLADFARGLPAVTIEIDATNRERVKFIYGGVANFAAMNVYEYPTFKEVKEETSFKIQKKDFKNIINKVIFNAAQEDSRPILKGVCLDLTDGNVSAVASNGYRLALASAAVNYTGEGKTIIVPARSLSEIARLIDDDDNELEVAVEKNYLKIDLFHTVIVTRLIEGDFINYKKIIPTEFTTEFISDKKDFEDAVNRASQFNKNDKKNVVRFEIAENNLNIKAEGEAGDIVEDIPIKTEGKDLAIGFNSKYIMESLRAITDASVKMSFTTSTAAGIMRPASDLPELYLILPIRIVM
ncbi:MAG TPA: DNA polymerase III subunit beta [Clostridia bacterium]|jgi:DNA polymerase-3 subunit beta|nr:DNA polymerase III subunit beta [Clostridia bacterium]HRU84047.1 DNA polymerase III subunit beta [Eubacteriales bacterium]